MAVWILNLAGKYIPSRGGFERNAHRRFHNIPYTPLFCDSDHGHYRVFAFAGEMAEDRAAAMEKEVANGTWKERNRVDPTDKD